MIVFPNAKINLGLNIVSKRKDGFHNIETVFYPVKINDVIEFLPSKKTEIIVSGNKLEGNLSDNLVLKAYNLLKNDFDLTPLKIFLHKTIPSEAGLGGGSADASFMLKALNEFFCLKLKEKELINYAEKLGSDCPFFIINSPSFASGRGEVLRKISLSLSAYYIVVIKPDIKINTAYAFKNITPVRPKESLEKLINLPVEDWKENIKNDFEISIFKKYNELKNIKTFLYNSGAVYASMSGSGSAVYGIFKSLPNIKYKNYFVWVGK